MPISSKEYFDLRGAFQRQGRVIYAVMLRGIRTRFFGHGLGYLIAIGWPLAHILILLLINSFAGRAPPFGDSMVIFVATGTVPFVTFSYLSRFMMMSILGTRPLLAFPEVKILDVLFASALLEILSASCVVLIMVALAWFFDIPAAPRDIVGAAYAFGASILMGLGFGVLSGVVALAFPFWATLYSLLTILVWITSGVLFVPDTLPEPARTLISYQPVTQLVEWMRSAYYEGYGDALLDYGYVLKVSLGALFLGLILERGMRGHLLALR
jgi:capsular polysaccharide transport system permease protein